MKESITKSEYAKNPRVVAQTVEGQAVLLNLDNGSYFVLNDTGTEIWERVDTMTAAEISNQLARIYAATEAAVAPTIEDFIDRLTKEGLLCEPDTAKP